VDRAPRPTVQRVFQNRPETWLYLPQLIPCNRSRRARPLPQRI
jgi:hypothetical protein